jgi:eukaryotic-like serine/threonine-protein kinase
MPTWRDPRLADSIDGVAIRTPEDAMTIEEVRERLVEEGLLSADAVDARFDAWTGGGAPTTDGDAFLRHLVDHGDLSPLQQTAIVTGVPRDFAIGPYRLGGDLGIGRIGRTFKAEHTEFDQPVSLKLFPSTLTGDPERASQLARETRVAVQVDNPHVVRTYQVGQIDRWVFLVMEPLQGKTLADRLELEGRLPYLESLRVARQIALGLVHLHEREILHRDVQPKNVWLHRDGRAILTEFAAAKDALAYLDRDADDLADGGFRFTEDALANYDYLAAEQGVDPSFADVRSDLYSLGCVLFRCLTGEVVYPDANPVRKMLRHALIEAPLVTEIAPDLPPGIDDVVALLLAKAPEDRYQRATDVVWAIEQLITTDIEHAVATAEVSPEFLAWANSTPDLVADVSTGVLGDREFIDFLENLVDEDPEAAAPEDDEELDASEGVLL